MFGLSQPRYPKYCGYATMQITCMVGYFVTFATKKREDLQSPTFFCSPIFLSLQFFVRGGEFLFGPGHGWRRRHPRGGFRGSLQRGRLVRLGWLRWCLRRRRPTPATPSPAQPHRFHGIHGGFPETISRWERWSEVDAIDAKPAMVGGTSKFPPFSWLSTAVDWWSFGKIASDDLRPAFRWGKMAAKWLMLTLPWEDEGTNPARFVKMPLISRICYYVSQKEFEIWVGCFFFCRLFQKICFPSKFKGFNSWAWGQWLICFLVVSNMFYFHPYLGRFPFWLVFFKWVETAT